MVIPWRLVLTAAAGLVLAAWWASRRGRAHGVADNVPGDVAIVLAVAALAAGRLAVVLLDVATLGTRALDPRAVVTLGAGVSTPAALLGALGAGAWLQRRGRVPEGAWRAVVPPVALGLAVWSVLALARGGAAGIRAPFPFGVPLPGVDGTRVPVALWEAIAFLLFAGLVWRAERQGAHRALARMSGSRLAALLMATAAGVHLLGGLLRPAVATVDGDIDVLLGLLTLALSVLVVLDVARRRLRQIGVVAGGLVGVLVVALAFGGAGPAQRLEAGAVSPGGRADWEGAIPPGGGGRGRLPEWDEARLAAFVAGADVPVVVNVWASWCAPCRAEAPVLARAARAYAGEVVFLGLNVDRDAEAARRFAARYELPFYSVAERGLRDELGVAGLPTTVVLRPDGTVATRLVGGVDAAALAAAIDRAR